MTQISRQRARRGSAQRRKRRDLQPHHVFEICVICVICGSTLLSEDQAMRSNPVKRLLREGKPVVGTWLSLGSITAARFLARMGFDYLTVDVEHSLVNVETTTHMLASIAEAGCVPLTRVPSCRHDHIKRVLDNGGYGIVVPMVCTREESQDAVSACLYPPHGTRSVGGSVHALNFSATPADYYAKANDEILIVVQCDHIGSSGNYDTGCVWQRVCS